MLESGERVCLHAMYAASIRTRELRGRYPGVLCLMGLSLSMHSIGHAQSAGRTLEEELPLTFEPGKLCQFKTSMLCRLYHTEHAVQTRLRCYAHATHGCGCMQAYRLSRGP